MSSKTGDLLLELEAENKSVRDKWVSVLENTRTREEALK